MRGMEKIIMSNFPARSNKFNTKATLCNLPYIRKNLETIMASSFPWWRIAGSNR